MPDHSSILAHRRLRPVHKKEKQKRVVPAAISIGESQQEEDTRPLRQWPAASPSHSARCSRRTAIGPEQRSGRPHTRSTRYKTQAVATAELLKTSLQTAAQLRPRPRETKEQFRNARLRHPFALLPNIAWRQV